MGFPLKKQIQKDEFFPLEQLGDSGVQRHAIDPGVLLALVPEVRPRLPEVAHDVLVHVADVVGLPVGVEEAHLEQRPLAPRQHLHEFRFSLVSHVRVVLPY